MEKKLISSKQVRAAITLLNSIQVHGDEILKYMNPEGVNKALSDAGFKKYEVTHTVPH